MDKKQELVDRYIRGEMNADERKSFEQLITEDEELNEMYKYTLKVSKVLKDRHEKSEKIEEWESEGKSDQHKKKSPLRWISVAVGVAAVVFVAYLVTSGPSIPEINVQQYENYRGGSSVIHVANLINGKQFKEALYVIEREEKEFASEKDSVNNIIPTSTPEEKERLRYELTADKNDNYELKWLKVYVYLGLGRYEDAREILNELRNTEGIYKAKADSLYKEL